jgi:endonuclease YncB( thermonuclease family)
MNRETGLTTEATIVRAIDGDTIKVKVERTFNLRIRDINCPEKNTEEGKKALAYMRDMEGEPCIVFIPSKNPTELLDINSFNRLVGDVYINEVNIADVLVEEGLAKRVKGN